MAHDLLQNMFSIGIKDLSIHKLTNAYEKNNIQQRE